MKIIKQTVQISKCYQILSGTSPSQPFLIEHSCLMTPGNEWDMEVKCRPISHGAQGVSNQRNNWRSLMMVYPEAKVQLKHNDIEVTPVSYTHLRAHETDFLSRRPSSA